MEIKLQKLTTYEQPKLYVVQIQASDVVVTSSIFDDLLHMHDNDFEPGTSFIWEE